MSSVVQSVIKRGEVSFLNFIKAYISVYIFYYAYIKVPPHSSPNYRTNTNILCTNNCPSDKTNTNMRMLGIEPSSVIPSQRKRFQKLEKDPSSTMDAPFKFGLNLQYGPYT